MSDVTVLVALDYEHLGELAVSWHTWMRDRPELATTPVLFLCDALESPGWWLNKIRRVLSITPEMDFVQMPRITASSSLIRPR